MRDGHVSVETATLGIVVIAVFTTLGKVGILALVGRSPFARRVSATLMLVTATGAMALLILHRVV